MSWNQSEIKETYRTGTDNSKKTNRKSNMSYEGESETSIILLIIHRMGLYNYSVPWENRFLRSHWRIHPLLHPYKPSRRPLNVVHGPRLKETDPGLKTSFYTEPQASLCRLSSNSLMHPPLESFLSDKHVRPSCPGSTKWNGIDFTLPPPPSLSPHHLCLSSPSFCVSHHDT